MTKRRRRLRGGDRVRCLRGEHAGRCGIVLYVFSDGFGNWGIVFDPTPEEARGGYATIAWIPRRNLEYTGRAGAVPSVGENPDGVRYVGTSSD